jgi:Flp pilus assembly protein TadD
MSDGFAGRLNQLRARWEGDRSSRIFLQLAEEYRHLGRVQDALEVLNAGLEEHPGYLSALVAKGRCLLELGDAEGARPVLERVVQQDPTQMVANKLLVRACLETGEPERARQRLELYSLLNDSDPEIEELERRVEAMSRPSQAADGPHLEETEERPHMDPSAAQGSNDATPDSQPQRQQVPQSPQSTPGGASDPAGASSASDSTSAPSAAASALPRLPLLPTDVFDLGPAAPNHAPPDGEDLFGLAPPEPIASPEPTAPPELTAPPLPAASRARGEGNGAEPFPDLAPDHSRRIYLAHLEAGQIFFFAAPALRSTATVASPPVDSPPAAVAHAPAVPPASTTPSPPAVSAAPSALATQTLAELYLRQGHVEEAERMFREVAGREPGNASARQALDQIERRRGARSTARPLEAAHLLAGSDPGGSPAARKTHLLQGYLARLRQPRSPHVP